MTDCRVFKRTERSWSIPLTGGGNPRQARYWVGICGDCGRVCSASDGFGNTSRKRAKDALHRHKMEAHQPGL